MRYYKQPESFTALPFGADSHQGAHGVTESKVNVAKDIVWKSIPSGPEGTKSCSQGLQSLVRKSGIHHKSWRDDVQLAGLEFSLSAAARYA